MNTTIRFPHLGLTLNPGKSFTVFGIEIAYYGVIIALGMLACAKESYAIGSARDEVKQAAAHVADTMHNQGVIKVLKEQLLK